MLQSSVAWESFPSSPARPSSHPKLGTARELARSQDAEASKPLLSPYPPVYSLGAA